MIVEKLKKWSEHFSNWPFKLFESLGKRKISILFTWMVFAFVLLCLETEEWANPTNDNYRWWTRIDHWRVLGNDKTPVIADTLYSILQVSGDSIVGNIVDDDSKIVKFSGDIAKNNESARKVYNEEIINNHPIENFWNFVSGRAARRIREIKEKEDLERYGAIILKIPPNYTKPYWRTYLSIIGADPKGNKDYFKKLINWEKFPLFVRSILFDAEPWWFYLGVFPFLFLTSIKLVEFIKPRWDSKYSKKSHLYVDAVLVLFVGFTFLLPAQENPFLPWPQRILMIISFLILLSTFIIYWRFLYILIKKNTVGENFKPSITLEQKYQLGFFLFSMTITLLAWFVQRIDRRSDKSDTVFNYPGGLVLTIMLITFALIWFITNKVHHVKTSSSKRDIFYKVLEREWYYVLAFFILTLPFFSILKEILPI